MKIGNLLIKITALISLIGFTKMFSMGFYYMEHSTSYKATGMITLISLVLCGCLVAIKREN